MYKYVNIFFEIFICSFLFSKAAIKLNPIQITDHSDIDDYIIIMNSETVEADSRNLTIINDLNDIEYKDKSYFLSPNIFLCKDESIYYFLFNENNYYKKFPHEKNNKKISSLNIEKSLEDNFKYSGCIQGKEVGDFGK